MTHSTPIPDDSKSPVSPEEQPTPSPATLEAEAEIATLAPVLSELVEPPEEPLTSSRTKQSASNLLKETKQNRSHKYLHRPG